MYIETKQKNLLWLLAILTLGVTFFALVSCDFLLNKDETKTANEEDNEVATAGSAETCTVTGVSVAGTKSFSTAARNVIVDGSYAYVATYTYSGTYGGLAIVNVSNSDSPYLSGTYYPNTSGTALYSYGGLAKSGNTVFVDGGSVRSFVELDVSTPSSPRSVTQDNTTGVYAKLYANGNVIYMTDYTDNSVYAMNFENEYNTEGIFIPPAETYTYNGSSYPSKVDTIIGNGIHAFVVQTYKYVHILNLPNLTKVASYPISTDAYIAADTKYLYICHGTDLEIVDISNPAAPVKVSTTALSSSGKVAVAYNCAFIGSSSGIQMYDISDKKNPKLISNFSASITSVNGMCIGDGYIYIADGGGGSGKLRIYKINK